MHPTSKPGVSSATRLIAPSSDSPARVRKRRRVLAVSAFIALLAAAAAIVVAAFAISGGTAPAATITPPPPDPTPTTEPVADEPQETTLPSGTAWLAMPAAEPVGIAVMLPDATDDARALLDAPAADALRAAGWAVATGLLGGESWGSAAASEGLSQLHEWATGVAGPAPVMLVGSGMGATTGVTTLARVPDLGVSCFYAVAPVTDLAALVGERPEMGARIAEAWGREPTPDDNPTLLVTSLPDSTSYRVVVPEQPPLLTDDANGLVASLESSGHTVTSVTASAGDMADVDDLTSFAQGCSG